MPNLAIIIVSWNVRDLLRRCLHSVMASLAQSGISYQILVVDNASSDGTPAMLYTEFPEVQVYESGHNLGFAAANNLALNALGFRDQHAMCRQAASVDTPHPDYILLLNPDTEIVADALPQLVSYLAAHPDLVAVGPQLRYANGHMQSSRRRFPSRLTFFWESTPLERCWPGNPWSYRYHCLDYDAHCVQRVDWLVGAALLVRGTAVAQAGLLDARFFLYSEELEWQYRLQATASRLQPVASHRSLALHPTQRTSSAIAYLPHAVIIHYEGQSSEQVPVARHLHFQQSKLRLAYLLYGRWFALVVRVFILICYGWELMSESIKFALGHRRPLRRQRIGVYATLLRSGLHSGHHP